MKSCVLFSAKTCDNLDIALFLQEASVEQIRRVLDVN